MQQHKISLCSSNRRPTGKCCCYTYIGIFQVLEFCTTQSLSANFAHSRARAYQLSACPCINSYYLGIFYVLFPTETENPCDSSGGGNATPLYVAPPTLYSHAHKGFSMIFVHLSIETSGFFIDRSRIGLLGSKQRDVCGRGLVGVTFVGLAIARFAR